MTPTEAFWLTFVILSLAALSTIMFSFSQLKKKRLIEDIPLSRIRSAAQGYVELSGTALPLDQEQIAPFSGKPCCYYQYNITKIHRQVNRQQPNPNRELEREQSDHFFVLEDETGQCVVIPFNANDYYIGRGSDPIFFEGNVYYYNVLPESYFKHPDTLKKFGNQHFNLFQPGQYIVTENIIRTNDKLFVTGYFRTNSTADKNLFSDDQLAEAITLSNKVAEVTPWLAKASNSAIRFYSTQRLNEKWDEMCVTKNKITAAQTDPGKSNLVHHISTFDPDKNNIFIISPESRNKLARRYLYSSIASAIFSGIFFLVLIGVVVYVCVPVTSNHPFLPHAATDSHFIRPFIPATSGHRFRSYPDTHSGRMRPLIPVLSGH